MTTVQSVSFDELLDGEQPATLVGMYLRDGDSKTLRLISRELARVLIHYRSREESETARPFQCNGATRCVACLGGRQPVTLYLMPAVYVPTATAVALSFGEASGPDSLRRQIAQILRLEDFAQKLIDVSKRKNRFAVKIIRTITEEEDGDEFGLGVVHELIERGDVTPEALAATIETVSNADILDESPALRGEIKLRHPKLDISTL